MSARGLALMLLVAGGGYAHEVRPAYLELRETSPHVYAVLWKLPLQGSLRLPLEPAFPETCERRGPSRTARSSAYLVERGTITCPGGLSGAELNVRNLELTLTDVLVRLETLDGVVRTARLRPERTSWSVPTEPSFRRTARTYLDLGVEHILLGLDHLLFVGALLLIVRGARRLLWTVTAFTAAHSLTLGAAVLGWVEVPTAPVEAVIALSILFLAAEIERSRRGEPVLTAERPWLVAFVFGLLHGFGFAGALAETGLPETAIPPALLFFNIGVELGQAFFILAALGLAASLGRLWRNPPDYARAVPAYAIGAIAACWTIERTLSLFP